MALALHALLGHPGVELTTFLALPSGRNVAREHRLCHQLLLVVVMMMAANGHTGTSRRIGRLTEERGREGERERERERERE